MRAEEVEPGVAVFWAGCVWAAGQMVAFVRQGTVLGWKDGKVEVEEPGGKRFLKLRQRLTTSAKTAEEIAGKLSRSERSRSRQPRRNGCHKKTYADKRTAATALNRAMKRHGNRPDHLRAYQCEQCRGWHLTRLPAEEYADRSASAARPHRGQPAGLTPDGKIQSAEIT